MQQLYAALVVQAITALTRTLAHLVLLVNTLPPLEQHHRQHVLLALRDRIRYQQPRRVHIQSQRAHRGLMPYLQTLVWLATQERIPLLLALVVVRLVLLQDIIHM